MNFEKIKTVSKVVALSVLMNLPGFAQALEKGGKNIDDLKALAKQNEQKIVLQISEKGQKGNIGNTKVEKWVSPDGQKLIVGYDENGKAKWMMSEEKNGGRLLIDNNLDGSADRMVLNKTSGIKGEKSAFNEMDAFTPLDKLQENAKVEADLDPENVFIYDISAENNGYVVKAVNFATGESTEVTGEEANKYVAGIQGMFNDEVAKSAQELGK